MFSLFNKFKFLYSPEDAPAGGGPDTTPKGGDKEDDIKFLGLEDEPEILDLDKPKSDDKGPIKDTKDKTDDKEDDDDETDKEDEPDELEALVDDLEDPTEEQLEIATPIRRREILKKYPTLFKDFPYLEKAYYREQQFTELLPTINDAKVAVEKSQTLDKFESDLMGGKTETILKAVKDSDPNSFYKIVDDYLPTLARIDEKAYHHVLGNTIKHTIISMVNEAKRSNNEVLQSAAQILNQFAFGNSEFVPPTTLSKDAPKEDGKVTELETKQREFTQKQFESTRNDLNTRLNNSLEATIEANIDPKSSMSDYVKRNAIREANETLGTLLGQDNRFKIIIDKLWEDAFKKNFSKDSTDRIRSAYLSKAKTLLPSVIKKARNEALKGMGKRVKEEVDDTDVEETKSSKPRSNNSGNSVKKGEIPKGMRTIDFLMQD